MRARACVLAAVFGCRSGANYPTDPGHDGGSGLDAAPPSASSTAVSTPHEADAEASSWTTPALVVDEASAYWFANQREVISQRPSGEGSPVVFARATNEPSALALDAQRVYWLEQAHAPPDDRGQLVAAKRSDGKTQVIASLPGPRGLVLDGLRAFVIGDGDLDAEKRPINAAIFRVPLDGGPAKRIATVPRTASALAADDQSLFVITSDVLRIAKTGGAPKRIGGSPEEARDVVVGRDDVFFVTSDPQTLSGQLWSVPKRGPAPEPKRAEDTMVMYAGASPIAIEGGSVMSIATDGARPFWVFASHEPDDQVASLQTRKAAGGDPVELAKVPEGTGLAVFHGRIHWTTKDGVKSLPLPR